MSNYTEADVERWFQDADESLAKHGYTMNGTVRRDLPAIRSAALEGAKMPGLVEALGAARNAITAWREIRDRLVSERDEARREVSALQARVKELERQGLDMARQVGELSGEVFNLTSERDALRAQVTSLRSAMIEEAASIDLYWLSPADKKAVADRIRAALSAPPAETTPAPESADEASKPQCVRCERVHGDGHVIYVCDMTIGGCGLDVCGDCSENAGPDMQSVMCLECYDRE